MTYLPHARATFRGRLPGNETWACSLSFARAVSQVWTGTQLEELAADLAPLWATMHGSGNVGMSTQVFFDRVDTYAIGPDGKSTAQGSGTLATPQAGLGTVSLPNQCAMTVSLRTGRPGRAFRGRFYLPTLALGGSLGTDGRLPAATRDQMAAPIETFLNAIQGLDIGGTGVQLVVASGVGAGANTAVSFFSLGRVLDTQRRRRSQLLEAAATYPVT